MIHAAMAIMCFITRRAPALIGALLILGLALAGPARAQISADEIERRLAPPVTRSLKVVAIDLDVPFAFDRADLLPAGTAQLDQLGAALRSERLAGARFAVNGHTDGVGSPSYNQRLSARRAEAVRRYLHDRHGIDMTRLEAQGYGAERLKRPEQPDAAENRRVEIKLLR